jgi:hypothetical protein
LDASAAVKAGELVLCIGATLFRSEKESMGDYLVLFMPVTVREYHGHMK